MKHYRAKLKGGRIIGPFTQKQIGELCRNGHLTGEELYSEGQSDGWNKLSSFPELFQYFQNVLLNEDKDQTKIIFELKKFQLNKSVSTEKVEEKEKESQITGKLQRPHFEEISKEETQETSVGTKKESVIGTKLKGQKISHQEDQLEKTVIRESVQRNLDSFTLSKKESSVKISEVVKEHEKALPVVSSKDETVVMDIVKVPLDEAEILRLEHEFEQLERNKRDDEEKKKEEVRLKSEEEKQQKEVIDNKKRMRKGMGPIAMVALVVIVYFLLFDEQKTESEIRPILPTIIYPIALQKSDYSLAIDFYNKATPFLNSYRFPVKMQAVEYLRQSYEAYPDDKVLTLLTLGYAELLRHSVMMESSKDLSEKYSKVSIKQKYGETVLKLIRELEIKRYFDINLALAKAIYFSEQKKYKAALNVLIQYQVGGGKITNVRFYTLMLNILVELELFDLAKGVFSELLKIPQKGEELSVVMASYAMKVGDYEMAQKILSESYKRFPDSTELLLTYARLAIYKEDKDRLTQMLYKIKNLNADNSGLFYAKYLENMGILSYMNNNVKQSIIFYKLSLAIVESEGLRARLSDLQVSSAGGGQTLILESKQAEFLRLSKKMRDEKIWDKALLYAIKAVDIPNIPNLDAKLYLASLQNERGYFNEALNSLKDLHKRYPHIDEISFRLIEAYINAYNFKEVTPLLGSLHNNKSMQQSRYSEVMALYNLKLGNFLMANRWLRKGLVLDPLNDGLYYRYSKNLMNLKQLDKAMFHLIKAIDLDPSNVDYRILYSQILHQQKGLDASIGYLNEILRERIFRFDPSLDVMNPKKEKTEVKAQDEGKITIGGLIKELGRMNRSDAIKLMSELAIDYHYAGQFKTFQKYRDTLEKEFNGSKIFYEFMAKVSLMEDQQSNYILYVKKIIELDPGNIDAMADLSKYMIETGSFRDAIPLLERIAARLESYPKLYYYFSRVYQLMGDEVKALEYAEKEISFNPSLEFGHVQAGEIYMARKDYNKARSYYKVAQAKNPNSVEALLGLANLSALENHPETALDLYLQASKLDPRKASIKRDIGMTYRTLGQTGLAIQFLTEYLEAAPDAPDFNRVQDILRRLMK